MVVGIASSTGSRGTTGALELLICDRGTEEAQDIPTASVGMMDGAIKTRAGILFVADLGAAAFPDITTVE